MFWRRPKVTETELFNAAVIEWWMAEKDLEETRTALFERTGENALTVPVQPVTDYVRAQERWTKADHRLTVVARRWMKYL